MNTRRNDLQKSASVFVRIAQCFEFSRIFIEYIAQQCYDKFVGHLPKLSQHFQNVRHIIYDHICLLQILFTRIRVIISDTVHSRSLGSR